MEKIDHHSSATAHQAWDQNWQTEAGRAEWLQPEADVLQAFDHLKERGVKTVLDLGCGVGRHSLALAQAGFEVWACDMSSSGLTYAQEQAEKAGHTIQFKWGEMTALPFEDASFDYVLAWNVIYHGVVEVVQQALSEIRRVLRPQGLFQATMLSKRHQRFESGTQVAPNVWMETGGGSDDHSHPHLFCNAAELVELYKGFELLSLHDKEQRKPDTYHWVVLAEKL